MKNLLQNNQYSRKEIYRIFNPSRPLDSIWKQWGIINLGKYIETMENDYIFLLTMGSKVSGHSFDEGITEDGVLSWQSQPQNGFTSPNIYKFINHDEMLNNIYFFYRVDEDEKYSFLGKLKYLSHDKTREKPVYFQWQILDWDTVKNKELISQKPGALFVKPNKKKLYKNILTLENPPSINIRSGITTDEFRAHKGVNYGNQDKSNKTLGLSGEKLVLEYEKKYLRENNKHDLANNVVHHSVILGDGLGYDILSFDLDGNKKHIEVKTTKGINKTAFFITPTELRRSEVEKEFYLYRVYNYCAESNNGNLYIKKGPLGNSFDLIPSEYRVKI